jgi:hypothetical protein
MKTNKKESKNSTQIIKGKELIKTPLSPEGLKQIFPRDVRYLKVKDIKRAYSKLIQSYCKGDIMGEEAKTLCYLFSGYLQLINAYEFEQRLNNIEKSINERQD